jgi:hypothetical protein
MHDPALQNKSFNSRPDCGQQREPLTDADRAICSTLTQTANKNTPYKQ